jgi:hypothetical protein
VPAVRNFHLAGEVAVMQKTGKTTGHEVRSISTALLGIWLLFCGVAVCRVAARAQEYAPPAPASIITIGNKKMASVDGRATPLLWADGITRVADLDTYAQTGLNTVVVRLRWKPADDGGLIEDDLRGPRGFAEAAAARGLNIVYALPAVPLGLERSLRTTGDSDPYFLLWSNWTAGAIQSLRDTPHLLGWMLPDDPRALNYADDVALVRWAKANFADAAVLNAQWKTDFKDLDELTVAGVEARINAWTGTRTDAFRDETMSRATNPNTQAEPWVWHPAALSLAQFRLEAYRALVGRWAHTIKETDPLHFVMSGRTPDYAQLLALPESIDIAVPDMPPGVAENDLATHNPQAIDIARRAGRFAALPMLSTSSPRVPDTVLPRAVALWMRVALAHGASGLGFASWNDLSENAPLRTAIARMLEQSHSTVENAPDLSSLWNATPQATAAVLLTPLADGQTLQIGRDPQTGLPTGDARGLYGFGVDLVRGEPSNLVWTLRWGTAFGSIDYLAPEDLKNVDLERYGALLMPQALSLDDGQLASIARFVAGGGAAVTDLGLGAAQNGWQVLGAPPAAQGLFGLGPPIMLQNLAFNLQSYTSSPEFPTFTALPAGQPLTAGDGPGGAAFSSPIVFSPPIPGTTQLVLARRLPQPLGNGVRFLDAMITLKPVGEGIAVFAPFRLWATWGAAQTGYAQFHGDLFARGAAIVQPNARAFVPAPGGDIGEDGPVYPQMINYPSEIALLNHRAPRSDPAGEAIEADWQYTQIQTPGVGEFLWSNALCLFPANGEVDAGAPRRPIPVSALMPDDFAARPRLVEINASVRAQNLSLLQLLPISAQNLGGGPVAATVTKNSAQQVGVAVWPNAQGTSPAGGAFDITLGTPGAARVTIYDDQAHYRVAPLSRHRVTITELAAPGGKDKKPAMPRVQILAADANGVLRIEFSSNAALVEVAPVETPPTQ